jgi:hypothetical protein
MIRTTLMKAATALSDVQEQMIETIETETAVKIFAARNMQAKRNTSGLGYAPRHRDPRSPDDW